MTWLRHDMSAHLLAWGLALSVVAIACVVMLIVRHVDDRKSRRNEAKHPLPAAPTTLDDMIRRSRINAAAAFAEMRRSMLSAKSARTYTQDEFEAVFGAEWSEDEQFVVNLHTLAEFRDLDALRQSEADR